MDIDAPTESIISNNGNPVLHEVQSLLERVKATQQQIAEARHIDLPIPETGRLLWARYRLLDPIDELEPLMRHARDQGTSESERALIATMEVLVQACEGLYVRMVDHGGGLEPIDPDGMGPAGYDLRFARFYDLPDEYRQPRDILRAVFNHNEMAIINHSQKVQRWMTDTSQTLDGELWEGG